VKGVIKFVLFTLIIIAGYFIIVEITSIKVTASELAYEYGQNKTEADNKYLNEKITVTGNVKAFYRLLGTRDVLELETYSDTPLFCFFFSDEDLYTARNIEIGSPVRVEGICVGMDEYKFVEGVKIEINKLRAD
jgi:hypothetical protein